MPRCLAGSPAVEPAVSCQRPKGLPGGCFSDFIQRLVQFSSLKRSSRKTSDVEKRDKKRKKNIFVIISLFGVTFCKLFFTLFGQLDKNLQSLLFSSLNLAITQSLDLNELKYKYGIIAYYWSITIYGLNVGVTFNTSEDFESQPHKKSVIR